MVVELRRDEIQLVDLNYVVIECHQHIFNVAALEIK